MSRYIYNALKPLSIFTYSSWKFWFRSSNYLFHFVRKNHFQPKSQKLINKSIIENKEKELLHHQLLISLQKCKTIEEQIKVFYSLVKLSNEDISCRYSICQDLERNLRIYFPSCSVHLIGSSANGLGVKGCDVDLSIQLPDDKQSTTNNVCIDEDYTEGKKNTSNKTSKSLSKHQLFTIKKILQGLEYEEPLIVIPGRCPILKFRVQNLSCDLSVNNRSALNSTYLMLVCGRLDERVTPLMQIIIYWAKLCNLVGGLSKFKTYAIFLMVIYFLQTRTPPVLPSVETVLEKTVFLENLQNCSYDIKKNLNQFEKSKNNQTIDELLREFFFFYGNYDFSHIICPLNGISMDRKSFATKFNYSNKFEFNTISIHDPIKLEWNVTTGVSWKKCKTFLKAIISVWQKYQDKNYFLPGPHHWGIASLINSEFLYEDFKDIKEFSFDLPFTTMTVDTFSQRNFYETAANNLRYILNYCLLFQCQKFSQDTNISVLEVPLSIKIALENLFYKNDNNYNSLQGNFITSVDNLEDALEQCIITRYICATEDTWSGRNVFITLMNTSKNVLDIEHEISQKMIIKQGVEKEVFYFLCECFGISFKNSIHLHIRLKPLSNDRFIPKLAVFLKEYIPCLMEKVTYETQNKN